MGFNFNGFDPKAHGDGTNSMGQADIDHLKGQGASDYEISDYIRNFSGEVGGKAKEYASQHTQAPQQTQAPAPAAPAPAPSTPAGSTIQEEINGGMFNFQGIMKNFYDWQPGSEDATGNAMKNAFMGNMVQAGFDNVMAKDMASHQTGLSQSTMNQAADLELRNTGSLMEQENRYNQQTMAAQYDYQNQYADNQVGRDVAKIGAHSEATQSVDSNRISAEAQARSMNRVTEGEQDRLTDTNKIETQGKINQAYEKTRAYEQRETDTNRIRTEGQELRESATHGQRIKSGNRNQEAAISRNAARSF